MGFTECSKSSNVTGNGRFGATSCHDVTYFSLVGPYISVVCPRVFGRGGSSYTAKPPNVK